ncbi:MAG: ABC transporter permease [Lepagella sp.]
MSYSFFLARRLSLSSGSHRRSPSVAVSITAVALSIAVMIAAVAIVTGFKREIRDKVVGFNSHISIYNIPSEGDDANVVSLSPSLRSLLDNEPYISEYSLEASIPAIFKTPTDFKGLYLRSINGKKLQSFIRRNLCQGVIPEFDSPDDELKIVISQIAARQLRLKLGDKIDTYFISDDIRVRRLEIVGIFNTHFDSYDDVLAYGSLSMIQNIADVLPDQGTSIAVNVDNFDLLPDYTLLLNNRLAQASADGTLYRYYHVENALSQGAGYFNWLSLLDTNVIVVLTLMIIVAVATLISGMLILILDKKRFIGIARAIGASVSGVRKVFVYLALKVACVGMLIGNVLSLSILWAQHRWHFIPLDADAYYIDFVPVQLDPTAIIQLNLGCLIVIYICLLLPSRFVAKISPIEAIRAD